MMEQNLLHWKQVKRDSRKQYEYACRQYNEYRQRLAQLALHNEGEEHGRK